MIGRFFLFCFRMAATVVWTGVIHSAMRIGQILHLGKLHEKRPCGLIGLWGKGLCGIMGIRIHRVNERSGPLGDVVVSNHLGFLDIPVLLSVFPAVFMIKDELGRMPVSGRALRNERHIFVKRENPFSRNEARAELVEAMKNGDRVIVFPEGRGSPGVERRPFKPFVFVAAKNLGKTVEVVLLDYLPNRLEMAWDTTRPMFPQFVRLLGRFRTHVSIEFLVVKVPEDPARDAVYYKALMEEKLAAADVARDVDILGIGRGEERTVRRS